MIKKALAAKQLEPNSKDIPHGPQVFRKDCLARETGDRRGLPAPLYHPTSLRIHCREPSIMQMELVVSMSLPLCSSPNLLCTVTPTSRPTWQLPVKERRPSLLSSAIAPLMCMPVGRERDAGVCQSAGLPRLTPPTPLTQCQHLPAQWSISVGAGCWPPGLGG